MQKTMGKLFSVCEWIMKLAYVNLLWFFFTIAGLIVFGIMPATVSLFTIVRKWQMKETELPIWETFLSAYKKEFRKSNLLGLMLLLIGGFLILDFIFLKQIAGFLKLVLFAPLLIISGLYLITLLYIFPVYVHYDLKITDYIKNSCLVGILHLHMTLLLIGAAASLIFLMFYQPSFIPFFSTVSLGWILMYGGMNSFRRVSAKQKRLAA
ncbi:YesL family protein [Bacillus sp. J33]|uniref:YesL family protein n=1 Tax=Bacillus sp. J33 TaxID=935836 RepID=UPI00047B3D70|nr:YesL family protein [Bacillus sp. J33]